MKIDIEIVWRVRTQIVVVVVMDVSLLNIPSIELGNKILRSLTKDGL